uniref:transcriptional activator Myb-like n=1 Tax=Oncorhynchus gorbuscha TaxID=8017 RepID=UPI001EAF1A66|nr:transcriptional activator Myb-like [Oncorhynchus gorbuscha]
MFEVFVVACEHYYHLLACNINLIGLSFLMDVGDAHGCIEVMSQEAFTESRGKRYGPKQWSIITKHLHGRIGKQCRERWHNHLNRTQEEDQIIYAAHKRIWNLWTEESKLLPGRRDNSIRITGTPPCVGRWSTRSTCRMSRHRSTRPRLPSREGPSPPAPLGTPAEPESLCHDYPHKDFRIFPWLVGWPVYGKCS